ncbi:MAG: alkaline phosphatase family protein [Actinomycetota bacterium]
MKVIRLFFAACVSLALLVPITSATEAASRATRARRPPVVLIVLENHEYGSIVGSPSAQWLNHTFFKRGTLFTRYHATHHPSLPNYLAMTSGTTNGCSSDECPRKHYTTNNIFHQLLTAGIGWAAWMESMPSRCALSPTSLYAVKHNPPAYYRDLFPNACRTRDRPYPRKLPRRLHPFTFITPNVCHDMHDCSVATGDRWLHRHVPQLLRRGAVVIITTDEGSSSIGGGGHVMTAIAGPHVRRGVHNHRRFNHFGLLAGLERWFGVARLHRATGARPLPI